MRALWESLGTGAPNDESAMRDLQAAVDTQMSVFSTTGTGKMSYREFMTMLAQPPWNLLLHDALERSIEVEREEAARQEARLQGIALLATEREALKSLWDAIDKVAAT